MQQTYAVCESCNQLNRINLKNNKTAICGSCKSDLPVSGAVVESSDQSLLKLIQKSPLPIVVDVWAPWCGPCRSFAPTFQAMSEKFIGKYVFTKINSEENPKFSQQLGVRGIPILLIFKNGREVARQSGAMPSQMFESWLSSER